MITTEERLLTPRFILVVATGLAYFLAIGMTVPTIPIFVEKQLGGHELAVGVAVGSFAVGAILLRPFAGQIGDRLGRRILIIGGAFIVAVAFAAVHVATSMPTLVATRIVAGIGEAAFFVGAASMITDLSPADRRGEALSYWSVAVYGGVALGPGLGVLVLQEDHYGQVWTISAALALLAAILGCFTRETRVEQPEAIAGAPRRKLFHRSALAPGLILFLGMIGLSGYVAFVSLYVEETGIGDPGVVLLVYGLVVLVVRIAGARLPDRLGPLVAGTIATGVGAVGLLIVGLVVSSVGLYVGTVVFAIGMSQLYPAMMILVLTGVPDSERSSAVGTVSSFFDGASSLGPFLLGGIAVVAGYRGAFLGGAVASLIALVLLRSGLDPRVRQPVDPDVARAAHEVPEAEVP